MNNNNDDKLKINFSRGDPRVQPERIHYLYINQHLENTPPRYYASSRDGEAKYFITRALLNNSHWIAVCYMNAEKFREEVFSIFGKAWRPSTSSLFVDGVFLVLEDNAVAFYFHSMQPCFQKELRGHLIPTVDLLLDNLVSYSVAMLKKQSSSSNSNK